MDREVALTLPVKFAVPSSLNEITVPFSLTTDSTESPLGSIETVFVPFVTVKPSASNRILLSEL